MNNAPLPPKKTVRGVTLAQDPVRESCYRVAQTDSEMMEWADWSELAKRERVHRHMNNETGAMEIAAQCLADYPDAPWELRMQLARQTSDESRHVRTLLERLKEMGGHKGEFPVSNFEWSVTMMCDTLAARLAIQNRTFEAGQMDLLGGWSTRWRTEGGDERTADIQELILADEVNHVRFANQWIKRLTQEDRRLLMRVAMAIRFLSMVTEKLAPLPGERNLNGMELGGGKAAPHVNIEQRREAEFSEDEINEILRQAGFRSIVPASA